MKTSGFAVLLVSLVYLASTFNLYAQKLKGNGNVIKQERTVNDFNQLTIDGIFNVYLTQGNAVAVTVETDENLQEVVQVNQKNNRLHVKWKKGASVKKSTKMNVHITLKALEELDINGVGNVTCTNTLTLGSLTLGISGIGNTTLSVDAETIEATVSAVGNIALAGKVNDLDIRNSGTGNLQAFDLVAQKLSINSSGIGNVEVRAEEEINIESSGIGSIYYKGTASVKTLNVSGIGVVKKM